MRMLGWLLVMLFAAPGAQAAPRFRPAFLQTLKLPKPRALALSAAASAVNALGGGLTFLSTQQRTLAVKPDFGRGPMAAFELRF